MGLFRNPTQGQADKKIFGLFPQSSIYGTVIPVLYGTMRITGNVIQAFNWKSQPAKSGGKSGKGGTKGSGQQYNYWTGLMIGLCYGVITGVMNVWTDRTLYQVSGSSEIVTIPPGGLYTAAQPGMYISHGASLQTPYSVTANDFGSPGSVTLAGTQLVPMTQVTGTPGPGQFSVDVNTGVFTFNPGDVGKTVRVDYSFTALGGSATPPPYVQLKFSLMQGFQGQAAWPGGQPANQTVDYTQLAYVGIGELPLGTSAEVPNFSWEVIGRYPFGGGQKNSDPSVIFSDLLTNGAFGPGFDPASVGDMTEFSNYCVANSIFMALYMDSQRSAASWLQEPLDVGQAAAVWSDGLLKVRSRGDSTAVGNGATFTPSTQPIYDLDDDDFIVGASGDEPLDWTLPRIQDSYNTVKVEWTNSGNGYQLDTIPEDEDWAVSLYGTREAPPIAAHGITDYTTASKFANLAVKRMVYERGTLKFTLGQHYMLLEPMDIITITDEYLGWDKQPFRIQTISENENLELEFEALIFPWSISAPTLHPKQTVWGYIPPINSAPADTNAPLFFEAPSELGLGLCLMIPLSGGLFWGGCSVWVSYDQGESYEYLGRHAARSITGTVIGAIDYVLDPDSTSQLGVDLLESLGELPTYGNTMAADKLQSLFVVHNELMAYETAAQIQGFQYTIKDYIRRGVYGTEIEPHFAGERFALLDGSEFRLPYTESQIGQQLYFKFTAFNEYGQMEQDAADVGEYIFTLTAPRNRAPFALHAWGEQYTFSGDQSSYAMAQFQGQNGLQSIVCIGAHPINNFSTTIGPPDIDATATVTANASANMLTGHFMVQAFGIDASGLYSRGSGICTFYVDVAQKQVSFAAAFPTGTVSYELWFGNSLDSLHRLGPQSLGGSLTLTITLTSVTPQAYGVPDSNAVQYHARAKRVFHGGICATNVIASTANTVQIYVPSAPAAGAWNNRYLITASKVGLPETQNFDVVKILSHDTGSTTCTLTVEAGLGSGFAPGDLVMISFLATGVTGTSITDSGTANPFAPAGFDVNAEKGHIVRVLADPSGIALPGDTSTVTSNTGTGLSVAPWERTPGVGTVYIIEEAPWRVDLVTHPFSNTAPPALNVVGSAPLVYLPASNLTGYVALIQVMLQNADGSDSVEQGNGIRMMYIQPGIEMYGQKDIFSTPYDVDINDTVVSFQAGSSVANLPDLTLITRHDIYLVNVSGADVTLNAFSGQTIEGKTSITLPNNGRYTLMPNA